MEGIKLPTFSVLSIHKIFMALHSAFIGAYLVVKLRGKAKVQTPDHICSTALFRLNKTRYFNGSVH